MSITGRVIAAKERKAGQETRKAFLEDPIVTDQLHAALLGIVRQVITRGEDSLSPNQRSVYEHHVLRPLDRPCQGCGRAIPWDGKHEALQHGGLCPECHDGTTDPRA
jgi:hypothetical protein